MAALDSTKNVMSLSEVQAVCEKSRLHNETVVLTNGCFDILHAGHIEYLEASAALGDKLIVAINSDESVSRLKGPSRPVNNQHDRAVTIASLRCVDAVFVFSGLRLGDEIMALRPDIYTKAGDYTAATLDRSEKDALDSVNARICIIPFKAGYSTTRTIGRSSPVKTLEPNRLNFEETLLELSQLLTRVKSLIPVVEKSAYLILKCLKDGGKLLTCGNGGSAADALHLAEELVGRYRLNRRSLPAVCLNADATSITCIGNDFGFENIFARPVECLANEGDVLVAFTTSGNSENIIRALSRAKELKVSTILLSGKGGGKSAGICDCELIVPSDDTARIQEVHTLILHQWLEYIDEWFFCHE